MYSAVVLRLITRGGFRAVGEAVSDDCRCQRRCGFLRRVNTNRSYSEQPDCQRCIREGLCSSDGDTEDRDMLERLRY